MGRSPKGQTSRGDSVAMFSLDLPPAKLMVDLQTVALPDTSVTSM